MYRGTDEKVDKNRLSNIYSIDFCCRDSTRRFGNGGTFKKRDVSGTPFESRYVLDESGNFIANIPFERYLYTPEYPSDEKIFDIRDYGASISADFIGTCLSTDCT